MCLKIIDWSNCIHQFYVIIKFNYIYISIYENKFKTNYLEIFSIL